MTVEPSVECDMCKGDGYIEGGKKLYDCPECKGRGYLYTRAEFDEMVKEEEEREAREKIYYPRDRRGR